MQQTGKMDPWDFHSGAPVIYESLIYFGSQNGRLLGFDLETGNIENEVVYGDTVAIKSGLLIDAGILYFGGCNGFTKHTRSKPILPSARSILRW